MATVVVVVVIIIIIIIIIITAHSKISRDLVDLHVNRR